jgi:leucyl aminopeptidase
LEVPHPIILQLATPGQTPSALSIQVQAAPAQPALGSAAKQTGDVVLSPGTSGQMVAIVSSGKKEKLNPDAFRQAGGGLARWLLKSGARAADLDLTPLLNAEISGALPAFLEGILLGAFQFNRYKKAEDEPAAIIIFLHNPAPDTAVLLARILAITSAVNLSRDWAHEPANIINPLTLAERLIVLAEHDHLKLTILDEKDLEKIGAGAILNVGKGSATPARLIILEYPGQNPDPGVKPVVLVGKALTFDSGGYSIKSTESIQGMKYDKCGGMTVAATLHLVSQLKFKNPVIGVIAAAENMISGAAYRPDDIIRTLSGKTVEIITTDAEGRLVLADALTYTQNNYQPKAIIDLATLTGGVMVALGRVRAGLMSNNDELAVQLFVAGEATHERLWRLPLDDDFAKLIKGDDADLKNSGGREGHSIIGGMFLKQFVKDEIPWAHLDIAAMADANKELPYCPKGATGFGVRLLIQYLENL